MYIAFLHTSSVHIDRFASLTKAIDSSIEVEHFVNAQLLSDALINGHVNEELFDEEIARIQQINPQRIICTCSTYGKLCEKYIDVFCIDEPVANHLVKSFQKILLVFASQSTKEVSRHLLERLAKEQNKQIDIMLCDCTACWSYFERGDSVAYKQCIADKIKLLYKTVDAVFLAQASMDGVQTFLNHIDVKIFTSPEIGMKTIIDNLNK